MRCTWQDGAQVYEIRFHGIGSGLRSTGIAFLRTLPMRMLSFNFDPASGSLWEDLEKGISLQEEEEEQALDRMTQLPSVDDETTGVRKVASSVCTCYRMIF